jgi:hypothetical protein
MFPKAIFETESNPKYGHPKSERHSADSPHRGKGWQWSITATKEPKAPMELPARTAWSRLEVDEMGFFGKIFSGFPSRGTGNKKQTGDM